MDVDTRIRAYEPTDEPALWTLKKRFERELGHSAARRKGRATRGNSPKRTEGGIGSGYAGVRSATRAV